jgi:hypothetical protein
MLLPHQELGRLQETDNGIPAALLTRRQNPIDIVQYAEGNLGMHSVSGYVQVKIAIDYMFGWEFQVK